jgi:hypothetical protein
MIPWELRNERQNSTQRPSGHRGRREGRVSVLFERGFSVWPRRLVGFVFGETACAQRFSLRERYIYFTAQVKQTSGLRILGLAFLLLFLCYCLFRCEHRNLLSGEKSPEQAGRFLLLTLGSWGALLRDYAQDVACPI